MAAGGPGAHVAARLCGDLAGDARCGRARRGSSGDRSRCRARRLLGLALSAQRNPPPQVGHVLALAAHNIPIAAWPLLLGVIGAHRHRLATHVADGVLLACIIANTLPVGAALGAYGTAVLPYIPQLPLEWGGLALGASGWLVQRRRALTVQRGARGVRADRRCPAVRRRPRDRRRASPMRPRAS